jgi:hypothetical protein
MDYWIVLGLLLAGCGVGALLTAIVYLTQLKRVKDDLQTGCTVAQSGLQVSPNQNDGGPQLRSA